MKLTCKSIPVVATFAIVTLTSVNSLAQKQGDAELLRTRETVWRAWFAGDIKTLRDLVPPETIVMSGSEAKWMDQTDVINGAMDFHEKGGKLLRLEFPRTEVQHFGNVAVIWSSYSLETERDGKRSSTSSRVTEIFVWQNRHWTNPGWHTDPEK